MASPQRASKSILQPRTPLCSSTPYTLRPRKTPRGSTATPNFPNFSQIAGNTTILGVSQLVPTLPIHEVVPQPGPDGSEEPGCSTADEEVSIEGILKMLKSVENIPDETFMVMMNDSLATSDSVQRPPIESGELKSLLREILGKPLNLQLNRVDEEASNAETPIVVPEPAQMAHSSNQQQVEDSRVLPAEKVEAGKESREGLLARRAQRAPSTRSRVKHSEGHGYRLRDFEVAVARDDFSRNYRMALKYYEARRERRLAKRKRKMEMMGTDDPLRGHNRGLEGLN